VLLPAAYYTPDALKGLSAFAAGLKARGVDAVVTPAGPRDAAELLRGFKAAGYMPGLFVARGATSPEFIKLVGMDAEGTAGFSSYEARAATSGNAAFVKAYRDRYQRDPDFHAACGWAAGKVLEAAVLKAGSFEQERLRQALSALDIGTVLGAYKVAADGSQVAATPFLVQIQKGRRAVIWPAAFRSAVPVLPTPAWSNRSLKP
jgi:branched-chain amino acid transport system substrate-binding protein